MIGVLVACLAAIVLFIWYQGAEARALARLSSGERAALFAREVENLKRLCGTAPRDDALEKRCRDRAEFLLLFPECDEGCRTLVSAHLPHATK